jgi:23S rRNA (adenine2503-C2)-methyltransferase
VTSLAALPFAQLEARLGSRARALAARKWLFGRGGLDGRIAGLAAKLGEALRAEAPLPSFERVARQVAPDGTTKLALGFPGATVEAVMIPGRGRSTVCLSSQAGCTRACTFCATARLGFTRNLSAAEIVLQYALAAREAPADAPARNVVFMGMGEPLDNLDAVLAAEVVLMEPPYPRLSPAHVTVSTSGVVPGMKRYLREGPGRLALSLNATTDALRRELMPHTRTWPIAALLGAIREAQAADPAKSVFVEYVLWDGVNDSDAEAAALVALLDGIAAHVNLIPHNPVAGLPFAPSPVARVRAFQKRLADSGRRTIVRWPKGAGIAAACGQLANQVPAARVS